MEHKDTYTSVCRERGLSLSEAAAELCYSPEHIHRALTGKTPRTARFCKALFDWSGGRIDLQRRADEAA